MSEDTNPSGSAASFDPVAAMIIDGSDREDKAPATPTAADDAPSAASPETHEVLDDADEDTSGEADADPEESVYDDDEDEPEVITKKWTVKDGDTQIEVDETELVKGYQRQHVFTKKTQELAEQRAAIEAQAQQVAQERAYYAQQLAQLTQNAQIPPEPDWRMAQTDPIGYTQARAVWEAQVRQVQTVQAEQQRLQQQTEAERQQYYERHIRSEFEKLTEALPEWKDATKAKQEKAALTEYLRTVGFTDDEIGQAADHRMIVMARKARLYDTLQAQRPGVEQKLSQAPKTLRPGATGTGESTGATRKSLMKQFERKGGVDAAAALIALG